jgi:hypothetical protein
MAVDSAGGSGWISLLPGWFDRANKGMETAGRAESGEGKGKPTAAPTHRIQRFPGWVSHLYALLIFSSSRV